MTEIRAMTMILRRMFSKKSFEPFAGIRRRGKLLQKIDQFDAETFDAEDVSELEADFMNVGESHKMHEKEIWKKKEQIKQQIVVQKYFKEKEPRFITYAEKELIHKLYKSNPDEWTVERLSESFPALPETIKKILHAEWSPKSIEKIMKYDNVAVENWKKFKAGKLPLDSRLSEHLTKFKDRKITLTDRESLAKQFVPKLEFKKPKSTLFSSIIQTYLDEKQNDTKLLSQEDNSNKVTDKSDQSDKNQNLLIANIIAENSIKKSKKYVLNKEKSVLQDTDSKKLDMASFNKKNDSEKLLTFNEFIKEKLEEVNQESPEEGITLLNIYKEQMDNQEMQVVAASDNGVINAEKDDQLIFVKKHKDVSVSPNDKNINRNIIASDDNLLDTSIKVWNKKVDTELNYAKPIKIAKHLYKPGMTYRISDCYYDDDGEFLYRVPGVYS
ncbi:uncharacterized protein LOC105425333 [Pogonomyrmex barbatus]|uniref:Uncharacterized protein LOC105425333 n=1 Tax=Pogonomyrmex barbatus TaxID=144034 RepID=A0A6I9W0F0_9HYME|nr:uncharacterized protein LOC105425333 [Pogonomyrmex barbatus]